MQHAETATPCPASPPDPQPDRPGQTMSADRAGADHPGPHRRPAAHRSHPARLRPPSRRDREAPLRQHRLQRHRGLLRHRPAVCDPRAPATRHPARHRAGARLARARGAGPGYRLRRTPRARDRDTLRPRQPTRRPAAPADPPAEQPADAPAEPPAEARVARKPARPSRPAGWNDPELFMPTLEELEAQVRRRPLGRTLVEICLDLAVVPGFCTGPFWNELFDSIRLHGGSVAALMQEKVRREKAFAKEQDRKVGEQLGLAGDGTRGAPPRAGVLHRRSGGRGVRSGTELYAPAAAVAAGPP